MTSSALTQHPMPSPPTVAAESGVRLAFVAQALLGGAAVALSLIHCGAVIVVWAGGDHTRHFLATRLLLGIAVMLPGAGMLASLRELRQRRAGLRSFGANALLLLASAAQTIHYEATFPALLALAAAWQSGWLVASRLHTRPDDSMWRKAAWVVLPVLALAALVFVVTTAGVSAAEVDP